MRDASYVQDPRDVVLLAGAASAIRRLNERDVPVIMVTNQSGIARGWLTTNDFAAVQAQLLELLADEDAHVTATYMCPHHPDVSGPCDCRKPGLGLYKQAIADHTLDPTRSVFIGDRWRDVVPASDLGGRGIMLDVDSTPDDDRKLAKAAGIATASSLAEAVSQFLATLPA